MNSSGANRGEENYGASRSRYHCTGRVRHGARGRCIFVVMQPIRVFALVTLLAAAASAQVTSLDEGSFTITRAGNRVGREDFSIRSSTASGAPMLVAHGVVVIGSRRIEPSQNADTSGGVLNYNTTVKESGRVMVTYSGKLARDHYQARALRPEGESSREFRLPPGTVAVEDDVLHQLWLIARRGPGAVVPVLAPLRNAVERVHVELVGTEQLTIDAHEYAARHLRLRTEGTGVTREVWLDASGRLLQVAVPASRLVAVRDDPPR